ncbi:molybdopterin synthase catalytic subunit [Phtheirospermum japonicum]|uniref:Molybdopterin synthase catalytic subunit n=1 Tax=Phtheirospermum japonicum TaxID=374723 RepID=A0A830C8F9_9LAMI|nr:molybdopterin synthase catalytic subunit [Phtheirospermum japonicum]
MNYVQSPYCGAIATFADTTRVTFDGKGILELRYEAYVPMSMHCIESICSSARSSWSLNAIVVATSWARSRSGRRACSSRILILTGPMRWTLVNSFMTRLRRRSRYGRRKFIRTGRFGRRIRSSWRGETGLGSPAWIMFLHNYNC